MEYGRLVVLGYSSYRVATVGGGAPPRSEIPASQQSFGLGVATGGDQNNSSSAQQQTSGGATAEPAVTRHPSVSVDRNAVTNSSNNNAPLSRTGSSSKKSLGQLWEPIGDQNAQYILQKRKRANGVLLSHFHHFCQKKAAAAVASTIPATPVFAGGSLSSLSSSSSSSSSPAVRASSKDLKVVTKRMMQAVDMRRAIHSHNNNQSEENTDNNSEAATSSSGNTGINGVKTPGVDGPFLMCVPMNDKDVHASVTEYRLDAAIDMFQIGRMPCRQNDFVIPGPRVGASGTISRFAARILCSREPPFECRLYAGGFDVTRKMTAAGHALKYCTGCSTWFKKLPLDHSCVTTHLLQGQGRSSSSSSRSSRVSGSSQRLSAASLSASASPMRRGRESNQSSHTTTRETIIMTSGDMDHLEMELRDSSDIPIDGVTKNGVRVWLPEHKQWFEVSVNGNLYAIQSRTAPSTPPKSSSRHVSPSSSVGGAGAGVVRHSTFNRPSAGSDGVPPILTDGAIIDLGGVQLQFQTNYRSPSQLASLQVDQEETFLGRRTNSSVVDQLERLNIQCPVQLHSLRFTRPEPGEETDPLEIPHVFPACGHVFGYEERIANSRMCPLCRHPGFLVKLLLKENSQLQSAAEHNTIPECVLNPCGHAISSKLASHYSKLLMPNGRAICPFCAVHLHPTIPFSRLYLYSEDEDSSQQA